MVRGVCVGGKDREKWSEICPSPTKYVNKERNERRRAEAVVSLPGMYT